MKKKPSSGSKKKSGSRMEAQRVKTAKGRKISSTLWLARQLNDPYVALAKREGYRSRAAFKLIELDEKFKLLKPGQRIVDLGAAPGGWTQVAAQKISTPSRLREGTGGGRTKIVALDILPISPLPGAELLTLDFLAEDAETQLKAALGGEADLVLSDMAPNTTGDTGTDYIRIMALVEAAFEFACTVLAKDGGFVAKVFQGGVERELLARMKQRFRTVKHAKPPASRKDSSETYVVAQGFKG